MQLILLQLQLQLLLHSLWAHISFLTCTFTFSAIGKSSVLPASRSMMMYWSAYADADVSWPEYEKSDWGCWLTCNSGPPKRPQVTHKLQLHHWLKPLRSVMRNKWNEKPEDRHGSSKRSVMRSLPARPKNHSGPCTWMALDGGTNSVRTIGPVL